MIISIVSQRACLSLKLEVAGAILRYTLSDKAVKTHTLLNPMNWAIQNWRMHVLKMSEIYRIMHVLRGIRIYFEC